MNEQVKMSDENIIYCLQTLAGFEPNDIDCDDFDIAVNDDQFATISIVETARLGYELTEKQKELIAKQAEQLKIMREAVSSASIALSECANELNCFIDMKNSDLESSVTSCTENQPDYFDAQTVHESMVVVNNLQKALSATEQK